MFTEVSWACLASLGRPIRTYLDRMGPENPLSDFSLSVVEPSSVIRCHS
jgi:hypothetical protein